MKLKTVRGLALAALAALSTVPLTTGSASAQSDNVLKIANASEIDTLDPHIVQDVARLAVKINTYDPLFRYVNNPPEMIPWIAKGYTASEDGLVYTVDLEEGAKFHDGSEITAEDVVYSMERILALKQGPARFFIPLLDAGNTKAIGKYKVEFTLKKAAAPFVGMLSELYVVNKTLVTANETDGDWGRAWLSKNTAGSGPFHVTEYDPAVGWYAERFKDHFKGWHPDPVDGIRFRTIREPNSQVLALMRGDIDAYVGTMSVDQMERLAKSPRVEIMEEQNQRLFLINMNNRMAPFTDVHVRRAFAYAFDYEGFIQGIVLGKATRNPAPIPQNMWGYPKGLTGYTYDIEKAKEELAKAEVKITEPVSIHVMTGIARTEQAAQVLQAGLRKIGVEAKIVSETWPTLSGKCRSPETAPQVMPIWASANYADPHSFVGEMYDSTRGGSYATCSYFKDPAVDALLAKAYVSQDKDERAKLYAEASEKVVEGSPTLFIYNEKWMGARNKRVKNYAFTPIGAGNFLMSVSLKD